MVLVPASPAVSVASVQRLGLGALGLVDELAEEPGLERHLALGAGQGEHPLLAGEGVGEREQLDEPRDPRASSRPISTSRSVVVRPASWARSISLRTLPR